MTTILNAGNHPGRFTGEPRLYQVNQAYLGVPKGSRCSIRDWGDVGTTTSRINHLLEAEPGADVWGFFADIEHDYAPFTPQTNVRFRLKAHPDRATQEDVRDRVLLGGWLTLRETVSAMGLGDARAVLYNTPTREQVADDHRSGYQTILPLVGLAMPACYAGTKVSEYDRCAEGLTRNTGGVAQGLMVWIRDATSGAQPKPLIDLGIWRQIVTHIDHHLLDYLAIWSDREPAEVLDPYFEVAHDVMD